MPWLTLDLIRDLEASIAALEQSTGVSIAQTYINKPGVVRPTRAPTNDDIDIHIGRSGPLLARFRLDGGREDARVAAETILRSAIGRCLIEAWTSARAVERAHAGRPVRSIETSWETCDDALSRTCSPHRLWRHIGRFIQCVVTAIVPPEDEPSWWIDQLDEMRPEDEQAIVLGPQQAQAADRNSSSILRVALTEGGARLSISRCRGSFGVDERDMVGHWMQRLRLRHSRWMNAVRHRAETMVGRAADTMASPGADSTLGGISFDVKSARIWLYDWAENRSKLFWPQTASKFRRRRADSVFSSGEPHCERRWIAWPVRTVDDARMPEAVIELNLDTLDGDEPCRAPFWHDLANLTEAVASKAGRFLAQRRAAERERQKTKFVKGIIRQTPLATPDLAPAAYAIEHAVGAAGILVGLLDENETLIVGSAGRTPRSLSAVRTGQCLGECDRLNALLTCESGVEMFDGLETMITRIASVDDSRLDTFVLAFRPVPAGQNTHAFNTCEIRWTRQFARIVSLAGRKQGGVRQAVELLLAAWNEPILIAEGGPTDMRALQWSRQAARLLDIPEHVPESGSVRLNPELAQAITRASGGEAELVLVAGRRIVVQVRNHAGHYDAGLTGVDNNRALPGHVFVRLIDADCHDPKNMWDAVHQGKVRLPVWHDAKTPVTVIRDAAEMTLALLGQWMRVAATVADPALLREASRLQPVDSSTLSEASVDAMIRVMRRFVDRVSRADARGVLAAGWQPGELGKTLLRLENGARRRFVKLIVLSARLVGAGTRAQSASERIAEILEMTAVLDQAAGSVAPQIEAVARQYESPEIDFVVEMPEPLPPVQLSNYQLRTVIESLVSNAVRAIEETSRGTGTIQVTVSTEDGWVLIEVRDDGVAIPPDLQGNTIFSPFTTSRKGPGGEGLARVSAVVTGKGGKIGVRTEGGWKVFHLDLPSA